MSPGRPSVKSVGRPRDESLRPRIINAARRLVVRHGYGGVTTAMIATAAGVSKQTLYRRWHTKADLVLDAFLAHARSAVDEQARRRGATEDIARFFDRTFEALRETGPAIRSLMAWAQQDPEFCRNFRERFIEPRRRTLRNVVRQAFPHREQLPGDAIDTAVIALYGAMWYRLLLDEPFEPDFADRLVNLISRGLLPRGPRIGPRRRALESERMSEDPGATAGSSSRPRAVSEDVKRAHRSSMKHARR